LGFILPDDADGNILQHTKQLQKIDLSMNKIPTLPPKFFKHQNSLEELYMQFVLFKLLKTISVVEIH
jgi:hypothetical protein